MKALAYRQFSPSEMYVTVDGASTYYVKRLDAYRFHAHLTEDPFDRGRIYPMSEAIERFGKEISERLFAGYTMNEGAASACLDAADMIQALTANRDRWKAAAEAYERGSMALGDALVEAARR